MKRITFFLIVAVAAQTAAGGPQRGRGGQDQGGRTETRNRQAGQAAKDARPFAPEPQPRQVRGREGFMVRDEIYQFALGDIRNIDTTPSAKLAEQPKPAGVPEEKSSP